MSSYYYYTAIGTAITYYVLYGIQVLFYPTLAILAHKHIHGAFKDPVRSGFNWFKVALWLMFLHFLFFLILIIVGHTAVGSNALGHLSGIARIFRNLGICALLLSIAKLAAGAHKVDNQQDSNVFLNFVRAVLGISAALFFATFIFDQYYAAKDISSRFYSSAEHQAFAAFYWIEHALVVLLFVVALATTVFSILKRSQARKLAFENNTGLPPMRRVWENLIPATIITLITTGWDVIYQFLSTFGVLYMTGASLMIVDVIISKWPLIAVVVILYVVGRKKEDGLWSVPVGEDISNKEQEGRVSV